MGGTQATFTFLEESLEYISWPPLMPSEVEWVGAQEPLPEDQFMIWTIFLNLITIRMQNNVLLAPPDPIKMQTLAPEGVIYQPIRPFGDNGIPRFFIGRGVEEY